MASERNNRKQGTQNDINGEIYQLIVRDYLEDVIGEFGVCNYKTGEPDVVIEELAVEVKGVECITTPSNTLWGYSWKNFKQWIPYIHPDLTHFAFLVKEKDFNSVEIIYFITIDKILDLVARHHALKRKTHWLTIPFLFVKMNYNRELSKID